MHPHRLIRAFRWTLLALALFSVAFAAEGKRRFNIPVGDASTTLPLFAEQADREIVFSPSAVRGVKTNAVNGDYTPSDAIELLVARTKLVATQDRVSGAFAVRVESAVPNARGAAQPVEKSDRPTTTAETTRADYVELSPFVVSADKDNGYQATSTLAGTRLNTPVKDLGAAISIYTKDFIEDLGATDSGSLLVMATGMEAAGPGGNFSGATNDINATEVIGDGVRNNPQSSSRTRGLASPNFARGFFATDIAFDTYNTERVTVNRGPNAILFGVGSPAGAVDTTTLQPNLNRNKNKIEVRYGNNDSLRNSIDLNRVLVAQKLAMRIAGLSDRERYNQHPAYEEKKRIYGAMTFEPYKSTSLRANVEAGRSISNRPITILPYNSVTNAWYEAGRQAYDWTYYDDPARNPKATSQIAGATTEGALIAPNQIGSSAVMLVYTSPSASSPSYALRSSLPNTSATARNAVRNALYNPLVNRDSAGDTVRFLSTCNLTDLPGSYWTAANIPAGQLVGFVPAGLKTQGFTDCSAFDFKNLMIDTSSSQENSFHALNLAFEQRAWHDRVGIEIAYDRQRTDRIGLIDGFGARNGNHIRIDVNTTLPNGEPNPNVGRPFVLFGHGNQIKNMSQRESRRATGFIRFDFEESSKGWVRWLGRHTLTGLCEESSSDAISFNRMLASDGTAAREVNNNIQVFARRPDAVVYVGPSVIGNNNALKLEPIRITPLKAGPLAVPVSYFVREGNATDPGHFENSEGSLVTVNQGGTAARELIKSQAAVLQSYWLRNHLVTLAGWRRDREYYVRKTITYVPNPNDPNDPGKTSYGFRDFAFPYQPPFNVAAEMKSYSAVLRWPKALLPLPKDADFSIFYNQSRNFTPLGGRINAFNETLPSPEGKTQEYGFNFSALRDRLVLRVNWFETSVKNQSYTPSVYLKATNNAVLGISRTWAEEGNINPHLVAQRNADIELLYSALPSYYRELYEWKVTGEIPNLSGSNVLINGSDTTDYVAKGIEYEVVFNPTSNWRILANIAKQETVQSNSMPFLKQFIARMLPVWEKLKDRPASSYPLGWEPGTPLPASIQTYGQWLNVNVLVPFATAVASEGSASAEQRKWRANLMTSYQFGRDSIFGDRLKGWGVGAAVRWQDRLGIGYPTTRNADESVSIDLKHPYYAPAETNADFWVSYRRKLWNGRLDWKVQLNVRNLIGSSDLIPIGVQPWGEYSTVRLAPERRWYITNTFDF